MATSFGDYINNLLNNIYPTGGMLSPEQQAAYDDAQAYAADPFRRQNAIRKAAEEAAAAAAAQQAVVDPTVGMSQGSDGRQNELSKKQTAFFDWMETTPEGREYKDLRGGALSDVLGSLTGGTALMNLFSDKPKEVDWEKNVDLLFGYPMAFEAQYNAMNPQPFISPLEYLSGTLFNSIQGTQAPAPVRDIGSYSTNMQQAMAEAAARYGTDPLSQQTSMLAAQDSWFNDSSSDYGGWSGTTESDTQSDAGGGSPSYGSGGWL